ncbi:MAG: hypothetical protein ACYS9C_00400 [Planctomycetota bacterium]|jgi:hypothetical protein
MSTDVSVFLVGWWDRSEKFRQGRGPLEVAIIECDCTLSIRAGADGSRALRIDGLL